jgi:hypothetical protein
MSSYMSFVAWVERSEPSVSLRPTLEGLTGLARLCGVISNPVASELILLTVRTRQCCFPTADRSFCTNHLGLLYNCV